jgi:hypothetical protein
LGRFGRLRRRLRGALLRRSLSPLRRSRERLHAGLSSRSDVDLSLDVGGEQTTDDLGEETSPFALAAT